MEFIIIAGLVVFIIIYKLVSPSKSNKSEQQTTPISRQDKSPNPVSYSVSSGDDEEGLATFTIRTSFGSEEEPSSNKSSGQWLNESHSIQINGRQITRGFFYYGGVLESVDGYGIEPSLVDEKRAASKPNNFGSDSEVYTDESLGYWPKYATLSKRCRGVYLDWLASERHMPKMPIGYVFIYFYGFERRIIENSTNNIVSDSEFLSIFNEIARLNKVYWENRSFRNYASNFLELLFLMRPLLLESRVDEIPETNNSLAFKVKLAKTVNEQKAISAVLAIEWLRDNDEYSLKMPARRCEVEFNKLFSLKYAEKFGEGIIVKPNKTKLRLAYYTASSSIRAVELDLDDLPDPSILKSPIRKLIPLAESCTDELNAYSRYLGKAETSRDDIAALMLLPKELVNETTSPVIESFKNWANRVIENSNSITSVKEFWVHTGLTVPKTISKKENELIINLASKADVGIAPDFRFHHAKLKVDSSIVLFTPSHGEYFEPTDAFNQTGLAIRLGAMVATIDGHIDDAEKLALEQLINHDDKISPTEKRSLHAYLKWRLNTPSTVAGLKVRIENLKPNEVETIKKFIIGIALADGKVDTSEIKQIEKLYTNLGLDKASVSSDIHNITSTKTPLSNKQHKVAGDNTAFILDEAILAMHESDTTDAKSMLGSIFSAEEDEVEHIDPVSQPNAGGLDLAHLSLYQALCEKDKWERNEVYELCQKSKLMVDGAIETINDWAYEQVDAPVLDDDGDIYVDLEIVEELKE